MIWTLSPKRRVPKSVKNPLGDAEKLQVFTLSDWTHPPKGVQTTAQSLLSTTRHATSAATPFLFRDFLSSFDGSGRDGPLNGAKGVAGWRRAIHQSGPIGCGCLQALSPFRIGTGMILDLIRRMHPSALSLQQESSWTAARPEVNIIKINVC